MPTRNHVPEGQTVIYNTSPPTSGDHWPRWAECGFFRAGLPDERITHNLEHSNIVVSYNLATEGEVDQLEAALNGISLSSNWGVTRFYDSISPGTVAVATWGVLDVMSGIDPARIAAFFEVHAGREGPERIPC